MGFYNIRFDFISLQVIEKTRETDLVSETLSVNYDWHMDICASDFIFGGEKIFFGNFVLVAKTL